MSNKISQVLNHNTIIVEYGEKDWIIFGKGIGFKKKIGDSYDPSLAVNTYLLLEDDKNRYLQLISKINNDISYVSERIISNMALEFGNSYNKKIHVSLLDHLNFAIKRYKDNLEIKHFFDEEVALIYPKEYQFSLKMLGYINDRLRIRLPRSEAAMIALHINSCLHSEDIKKTSYIVNIVSDVLNYLENEYGMITDDLLKSRFIVHLKFSIKRRLDNINLNNDLEELIKLKYQRSYNIAKDLNEYLKSKHDLNFNNSEICFLALHIHNIFNLREDLC